MQVRAKKSQLTELRNQMFRERRFAAVFFDDGNNFVFDELPRRLPNQFFFVVQLRIKIDEVDSAISSHTSLLVKASRPGRTHRAQGKRRALLPATRERFLGK